VGDAIPIVHDFDDGGVCRRCSAKLDWIKVNWPAGFGPGCGLPSKHAIAQRVADKHRLTVADLKGPSRERRIAWPRQELMAELYATGRLSYPVIGAFLGGRDHTTVMYGVRRHHERQRAGDVDRSWVENVIHTHRQAGVAVNYKPSSLDEMRRLTTAHPKA